MCVCVHLFQKTKRGFIKAHHTIFNLVKLKDDLEPPRRSQVIFESSNTTSTKTSCTF